MKIRFLPKIPALKRMMPRTLFGRSLMIIVVPVLVLQVFISFIFVDKHWTAMRDRLNFAVAGEIAMLVEQVKEEKEKNETINEKHITHLVSQYSENLELLVSYDKALLDTSPMNSFVLPWTGMSVETVLSDALREVLSQKIAVSKHKEHKRYKVLIWFDDGSGLHIILTERRLFSSTSYIFILWLIGASVVLFAIAAVFMRNQIRPIRRLSVVADRFGKGDDFVNFKPQGAREVRQAATAFINMKDRIKRQIEQRTAMLAGVSHDLRTPLTRMKLQLELLGDSPDVDAMRQDVLDMEHMIEGYLDFAKGEGNEKIESTNIKKLIEKISFDIRRQGTEITVDIGEENKAVSCRIRPKSIERALGNILGNACKYGDKVWIALRVRDNERIDIIIDDDGTGIPEENYEDVFKPFFRMDKSRNSKTGGVGLGLSIVSDIFHTHGGYVKLDKSPHGGLRVVASLPL